MVGKTLKKVTVYEIMHMEKIVAKISSSGKAEIFEESFMPYDLYLDVEDDNDIDVLVNNVNNFNHWCRQLRIKTGRIYHCRTDVFL